MGGYHFQLDCMIYSGSSAIQELVLRNNSRQFPTALTLQLQHGESHFSCYPIGGTRLAFLTTIKQLLGSMHDTSAIELHRKLRNEGLDHAHRN